MNTDQTNQEGPGTIAEETPSNVVQLQVTRVQDSVRKLQVKAAVNRREKERYEKLAVAIGTPLSILIRQVLDEMSDKAGV